MPAIDWIQSCWVGAFVLFGFGHGSRLRSLEGSRWKTVVNNLPAISRPGLVREIESDGSGRNTA
jgi:hypothetical protein